MIAPDGERVFLRAHGIVRSATPGEDEQPLPYERVVDRTCPGDGADGRLSPLGQRWVWRQRRAAVTSRRAARTMPNCSAR